MLRANNLLFPQPQPLGKHLYQCGVEGQGTALKNNGSRQLQSLGQSTDGLLGNGMERGQGNIRPFRTLNQKRLNIRLGKHTAPAGDTVNSLSLCCQLFKFISRHAQKRGDLINKRAGTAGAAAVHPHVRGLELTGRLVIMEKDHFGILSAQLHSRAHLGIQRPDGRSIGHDFLHIMCTQNGGNGAAAGTADTYTEPRIGKPPGSFLQKLPGRCLPGVHCAVDSG